MTQSRASTPPATVGAHSVDANLPGLSTLLFGGAASERTTGKPASVARRPTDATASPVSASAIQSQAAAATGVTGQLIEYTISNNGTYYVNSDGTSGKIQNTDSRGGAIAVDSVLGIQFRMAEFASGGSAPHNTLFIGSLTPGAGAATLSADFDNYYKAHFSQDPYTTQPGLSVTVDTANHKLYTFIGSANTSDNTVLVADYSVDASGQVRLANIHSVENSPGNQPPSFFSGGAVFDGRTGNVYVADAPFDVSENGVFRISCAGGQPVSIVNAAGIDRVSGVALDRPDDRLYFSTTKLGQNGSGSTGHLYVVANPDSASNRQPVELRYAANVTAPTLRSIRGIAYDENAHVLYVGNNYDVGAQATQTRAITYLAQCGFQRIDAPA